MEAIYTFFGHALAYIIVIGLILAAFAFIVQLIKEEWFPDKNTFNITINITDDSESDQDTKKS